MSTEATPLTKRQIIERDEPLLVAHPLREWLRHGDHCPSRRMRFDMLAVDGPCTCGLTATLTRERAEHAALRETARDAVRQAHGLMHYGSLEECGAGICIKRRAAIEVKP